MYARFLAPALWTAFIAPALAQAPAYDTGGTANETAGDGLAPIGDLDGDGIPDFLVGAPTANGIQAGAGLVRVQSGKTTLPILTLLGEGAGDRFGDCVASMPDITGDGKPEVLVGAPSYDGVAGGNVGAAYVFSGANGVLLAKHVGTAPNYQQGWRVLAAGDVNLDGVADYAVSAAHGELTGASPANSGVVRIYSGASHLALRSYGGSTTDEFFGYDIDTVGDLNGDGRPDLLAGAPGFGSTSPSHGKAVILSGAASSTVLYEVLGSSSGEFGFDVAGVLDVSGDGLRELAIGEPGLFIAGANAGRVRLYRGLAGSAAFIRNYDGAPGDRQGWSVAGLDDFDGDGRGDLIIGAMGFDNGPDVDSGIARVYSGLTGALLSSMGGYDFLGRMGWSVASAGDLNSDGATDAMAAAPFAEWNGVSSGHVRVHLGNAFEPVAYCTAKVNSAGCTPLIGYSGCASLSLGNGLGIHAVNVMPGQNGLMAWSLSSNSAPFFGGTLCLGSPLTRTPIQAAGTNNAYPCTGAFQFLMTQTFMNQNSLTAGMNVFAQYWSRDSGFVAPDNVGLTPGLQLRILL